MYTLGINAAFHDSSACIVKDGQLLAAVEEERFTHIKHGKRPTPFSTYELPYYAIDYCLRVAGLNLSDIDYIAYSFDPNLLDAHHLSHVSLPLDPDVHHKAVEIPYEHPLFLYAVKNAPVQLVTGFPHHLRERFLGCGTQKEKWNFVSHHLSHAVSAFHASPHTEAAVLTIDGRGERATTSYYKGEGNDLIGLGQVNMPHSLGLLYENVTSYLGFLHSSDEYKVMALASFGKPEFLKEFRSMIHIRERGDYTIDQVDLSGLFGPARKKGEDFTRHHFNIAHSLQVVLQESVLELIGWLQRETRQYNLCMAGGVALNCVLNAYLRDHGPFKNIWVQPAAGDAGTALGAALWVDAKKSKRATRNFVMHDAYWGPAYPDNTIEDFLKWAKVPYKRLVDVAEETASLLAANKIVGWFQGRMEFGPRALGSRSILASPIDASMQARLNEVKDREDFRPVAPVVLEEEAHEWFEGDPLSPFMLFVYNVKQTKADKIPAVCHVDGTARIQSINAVQHPLYYSLLKAFRKKTGIPILINTSFNTLGKPIVCSPRDAIECFWTSPFDALVIGSFLLEKNAYTAKDGVVSEVSQYSETAI